MNRTALQQAIDLICFELQEYRGVREWSQGYEDGLHKALHILNDLVDQEKCQIVSSFNHGSSGFSIGRDGEKWYDFKYGWRK